MIINQCWCKMKTFDLFSTFWHCHTCTHTHCRSVSILKKLRGRMEGWAGSPALTQAAWSTLPSVKGLLYSPCEHTDTVWRGAIITNTAAGDYLHPHPVPHHRAAILKMKAFRGSLNRITNVRNRLGPVRSGKATFTAKCLVLLYFYNKMS